MTRLFSFGEDIVGNEIGYFVAKEADASITQGTKNFDILSEDAIS